MTDAEVAQVVQALVGQLNETLARAVHENKIETFTEINRVLHGDQEVFKIHLYKKIA